jgi:LacI family transcriptional regulator
MPDPSPKAIRLTDVAARAGVSTATVSRVLNGLGPTSEDVRGRVLRAAKELDYHPNWLAQSLRARRTNTVGLVLPDIENPFFTSLVKGAERAAGTRGWNLILCNSDENVEREEALVRTLAERKIDGLLLCAAAGPHHFLARYQGHLPIVAVNRLIPGAAVPSVTADNQRGAYEAAVHLLAKGLRPLALLLGTPDLSTTESRLAGCRRAAEALGVAPADMLLKVGYGRMHEGYKAAAECLDETPRPRAIVAFNNLMAEAALRAIHDRGLQCPDDVALIGFDDFRSAAAMTPPLTVVEQDPVGMGEAAVEVLGGLVASGEAAVRDIVLPARLLLRASCGCSASAG